MNKKLFKLEIIGFIFTCVIGTISHFIFEWSSYSKIFALFCPVNESVWEHLKLLFFPYLIWSVMTYYSAERKKELLPAKLIGAVSGMGLIVIFFYTYTGITGKMSAFLNVLSFFIGVLIAFLIDYLVIKSGKMQSALFCNISIGLFAGICIVFFIFTFVPPFIPLFKDPINLNYGI